MRREAERNVEDLKPTDAERALGSYDDIVAHRERERDALLQSVGATPVADEPTVAATTSPEELEQLLDDSMASRLGVFADADRAGQQGNDDEVRAMAASEIDPLVSRAHSAATRLGLIIGTHKTHADEIARVDWRAVLRRVPIKATAAPRSTDAPVNFEARNVRPDFTSNHERLVMYSRKAVELATSLAAEHPYFPDLALAVADLEPYRDPSRYLFIAYDFTGHRSQGMKRARLHVESHLERAERQVAAVEGLVKQFLAMEAKVKDDLADVGPLESVPPAPKNITLPRLPDPPREYNVSYLTPGWDVRSNMRDPAPEPDPVTVEKVGKDNFHSGPRRSVREGGPYPEETRTTGVTTGRA